MISFIDNYIIIIQILFTRTLRPETHTHDTFRVDIILVFNDKYTGCMDRSFSKSVHSSNFKEKKTTALARTTTGLTRFDGSLLYRPPSCIP